MADGVERRLDRWNEWLGLNIPSHITLWTPQEKLET
jgi:hypothetical protein